MNNICFRKFSTTCTIVGLNPSYEITSGQLCCLGDVLQSARSPDCCFCCCYLDLSAPFYLTHYLFIDRAHSRDRTRLWKLGRENVIKSVLSTVEPELRTNPFPDHTPFVLFLATTSQVPRIRKFHISESERVSVFMLIDCLLVSSAEVQWD